MLNQIIAILISVLLCGTLLVSANPAASVEEQRRAISLPDNFLSPNPFCIPMLCFMPCPCGSYRDHRGCGFQSIGNEQCCTKNGQVYSITVQPNESIEAELILISVEDFLLPLRTYLPLINVEDLSQASKSQSALCPQRELSANEQQVLQPSHPPI
ncbi:unnamed protein product [Rotaria sp. Silwood1]|nr:unnamed protein product [Rotaria sp. Silwood1]CAF3528150.1 unnamed protein product [Rotaria sp. Silwood1]CAF4970238.1 unnamed protein product [Rotaria sp. Silwood1]